MSKFYIDYKTSVWQRAKFKDKKSLDLALKVLQEEGVQNIFDEEIGFVENETLFMFETEEYLAPKDNDGFSTVEVYVDDELIWQNGN